jgi:hypothetical protein
MFSPPPPIRHGYSTMSWQTGTPQGLEIFHMRPSPHPHLPSFLGRNGEVILKPYTLSAIDWFLVTHLSLQQGPFLFVKTINFL